MNGFTDTILLSDEQQAAVDMGGDLSIRICSITGQAGTGKTTILKQVYERLYDALAAKYGVDTFDKANFSIAICAPTGRAAKRVEEATGLKAMTIHRLLRFSVPVDDDDFGLAAHTKMNPLPDKAILVDEASMINEDLRRFLIDAMNRNTVIRFFGDVNQLPPIGGYDKTGKKNPHFSPFARDLNRFPSVVLTKNFRSTDGIIELADRIIKNKMPMNNDQVAITRVVVQSASNAIMQFAEQINFTGDKAQIICPTNITAYGTDTINRAIQQRFNSEKDKITTYKKDRAGTLITRSFKRGDKVLWTENDYAMALMNGSLGRVIDFDKETGTIWLNIDNRDVEIPSQLEAFNPTTGQKYTYDPRLALNLGYAISTHKSQGSQFDTVLFVCSRTRAATRQNVYTAVTRAKSRLLILNIAGSLSTAIENKVDILRETISN